MKRIILAIFILLAVLGYVYISHINPNHGLNLNVHPKCNYQNPSEVLNTVLTGINHLYRLEEAPIELIQPSDYQEKFTGKANDTAFGLYVYQSWDSCRKAYDKIISSLRNFNCTLHEEKKCIWTKNNEAYYINCMAIKGSYVLIVVKGSPEEIIDFVDSITPLYYGPSPQKVVFYTLTKSRAYESPIFGEYAIPFREGNWTEKVEVNIGGYLYKVEGVVDSRYWNGKFPINVRDVRMAIYVYPEGCGKEVFLRVQNALTDSWEKISVPTNVTEKKNFIGTLIVGTMFKKGNIVVYVEYSRMMGFDRVIILYGNEKDVKKLASILM
ncbi:MAG: hypothetical protein PWP39_1758 [Pyrococcus sp.]|uniref:hypothetical protein n=1 Tax=Pyrococcus sp. TaxID=33866 RepID=UPI00258FD735|nr:hypothetical protein [Pyrococcus sp.]MDK2870523.1 hypothetical protein [Pyrococcus sp.]